MKRITWKVIGDTGYGKKSWGATNNFGCDCIIDWIGEYQCWSTQVTHSSTGREHLQEYHPYLADAKAWAQEVSSSDIAMRA